MESFDFIKYLENSVDGYDGKHSTIIQNLPYLYTLLEGLIQKEEIAHTLRNDVYVTFGYLFFPYDLYSEEEHGPIGFVDDILLILFVINKIRYKHGIDMIKEYWTNDGYSIETLISEDFNNLKNEYDDLFIDVLRTTGFVDESF